MSKFNASPTLQTANAASTNAPSGILQRKCDSCGTHTIAGGKCEDCENKKDIVQRKSSNNSEPSEIPPIVHEVLQSAGQPLDAATRAFMEPRFGHDFSRVPTHTRATGALTIVPSQDQSENEADKTAHSVSNSTFDARESDSHIDFSRVRVHTDPKAAASARAINATAYTVGNNVVFGAGSYQPATRAGQQLLAHELTHVAQQHGAEHKTIRRFEAEDAAVEMIGKTFLLNQAVTVSGQTLLKGSSIVITAWSNTATDVTANFKSGSKTVAVVVGKQFLTPVGDTTSGLHQYHAGVTGIEKKYSNIEAKIKAQEKVITDWKAKKSNYTTTKGQAEWQRQMDVHETELKDLKYKLTGIGFTPSTLPERLKKEVDGKKVPITPQSKLLNTALIEQTMFNTFDANIVKWVKHYNSTIGKPNGWSALDANIVKSMIYQESHMGTFGQHLLPPPYTKGQRKTRFNIGQAIDSSGPQQILMIKETSPAIATKHNLDQVTKDMWAAQKRRDELVKKGTAISTAEQTELDTINARSDNGKHWNDFFTSDPRWTAAVEEFFAQTTKARNLDYDFWIQTAVRWLFEKRKSASDWAEAIKAYNGDGGLAAAYKKSVIGRRDAAKAAKGEFIPKQDY